MCQKSNCVCVCSDLHLYVIQSRVSGSVRWKECVATAGTVSHVSCVTCHVSHVTCHVSPVTFVTCPRSAHLVHVELAQQHGGEVSPDAVGGREHMPGGDQRAATQVLHLPILCSHNTVIQFILSVFKLENILFTKK